MVNSRILLGNFCLRARCFLHNGTDDIYLERNSSAAAQHSFPTFFFFRSMQFAKGAVLLEVEASDQHHLIFIFHSHLRPLSGDHLPCNEKIPILDPIESQYKCNSCNKGRCGIILIDLSVSLGPSAAQETKLWPRKVDQWETFSLFEINRQPNVGYYYSGSCLIN